MSERVQFVGPGPGIVAIVRREYAAGRTVTIVPAGRDKPESLRLFAEVLDFPAWVGHNLDALFDALREHVRATPYAWALIWDATAELQREDPEAYEGIVAVLGDLAEEFPEVHPTVVDR